MAESTPGQGLPEDVRKALSGIAEHRAGLADGVQELAVALAAAELTPAELMELVGNEDAAIVGAADYGVDTLGNIAQDELEEQMRLTDAADGVLLIAERARVGEADAYDLALAEHEARGFSAPEFRESEAAGEHHESG